MSVHGFAASRLAHGPNAPGRSPRVRGAVAEMPPRPDETPTPPPTEVPAPPGEVPGLPVELPPPPSEAPPAPRPEIGPR